VVILAAAVEKNGNDKLPIVARVMLGLHYLKLPEVNIRIITNIQCSCFTFYLGITTDK
jgi:hypothetical protein